MPDKINPAMTLPVSPDLRRLSEITSDMQTDFANAYDLLCHIGELLFESSLPSEAYEYNYNHFESMFWLAVHTLGRFAGQYDLLMGGSGNRQLEVERKIIDDLKVLGGLLWKGGDNSET